MMDGFLFDLPDLRDRDFSRHNNESRALWEMFHSNTHERIPIRLNVNARMLMLDPAYNTRGITYDEYMHDPEVMGQAILELQYWRQYLMPGDHEKGLPKQWDMWVDFQNFYDAAYFGGTVEFRAAQIPDAAPILNDDNKRMIFDRGLPEPFSGEWPERGLAFLQYFKDKSDAGWTFLGRPVIPVPQTPFMATDGLFTTAACLRGPTGLCTDLLMDPDYTHELLGFLNEGIIRRMVAWRERFGCPVKQDGFITADDSVQMLSEQQYREFVLPHHRRLFDTFGTNKDRGMHLCGNAQRHFIIIQQELGVAAFDTGFPFDFGRARRELGTDTLISGGPRVPLFVGDNPAPLLRETECILASGVLDGGRFILQEGNNLPPRARLALCDAFYETGKRLGVIHR